MKYLRTCNRAAMAATGLAIAAAMLGAPGTAIALVAIALTILVRNLEALRAHMNREKSS